MTDTDEQERRSRAHTFAGGAASVIAIGAVPLFGWPAGLSMALVALGNFVAGSGMRTRGRVSPVAWMLMGVGVTAFVLAVILPLVLRH